MWNGATPNFRDVVLDFLLKTFNKNVVLNQFPARFECSHNRLQNSPGLRNPCIIFFGDFQSRRFS